MNRPTLISPSLLSCDFANLAAGVRRAEEAGADWLHVDVMDGHFVPNLTIGPPVVRAIHAVAQVPLDVHLMITDPLQYAEAYARAGAHVLTFHAEVVDGARGGREVARAFRDHGVEKVGVSVNPDTPIEAVEDLLPDVDLVLVMSVHPGFGGQKFIPDVLGKVEWLRAQGYEGHVEMDGGVSRDTIARCAAAGTDAFVSGSALFGAPDMAAEITRFREIVGEARAGVVG